MQRSAQRLILQGLGASYFSYYSTIGVCFGFRTRVRFRPIADFRHDIVCAYEIERRPRGASRINPLLRLFLANYV